jgi:hypothetical protein
LNHDSEQKACGRYVTAVRELFLGLECTSGRFGPPEERQARDLEKRGISLQELEDAMIVAACRKYVAWLNHGPSDSIASLRYFESLLEEVRQRPFPPGYRDYLRMEVKRLAELWKRSRAKNQQPSVSENDSSTSNHPNREISAPSSEKETR